MEKNFIWPWKWKYSSFYLTNFINVVLRKSFFSNFQIGDHITRLCILDKLNLSFGIYINSIDMHKHSINCWASWVFFKGIHLRLKMDFWVCFWEHLQKIFPPFLNWGSVNIFFLTLKLSIMAPSWHLSSCQPERLLISATLHDFFAKLSWLTWLTLLGSSVDSKSV